MKYRLEYYWDRLVDWFLYGSENAQLIEEFYWGDLRRATYAEELFWTPVEGGSYDPLP